MNADKIQTQNINYSDQQEFCILMTILSLCPLWLDFYFHRRQSAFIGG